MCRHHPPGPPVIGEAAGVLPFTLRSQCRWRTELELFGTLFLTSVLQPLKLGIPGKESARGHGAFLVTGYSGSQCQAEQLTRAQGGGDTGGYSG